MKEITEEQYPLLIKHATLWHGDHDGSENDPRNNSQDSNSHLSDSTCEPCDVYVALQYYKEGKGTIQNIIGALDDTDDEWRESFNYYIAHEGARENCDER